MAALPDKKDRNYKPRYRQACRRLLEQMPDFMIHTVDFGQFERSAVFDYFVSLCNSNEIAGCVNKTLIESIKAHIAEEEKVGGGVHIESHMSAHLTLQQIKMLSASFQNNSDEGVLAACFLKENHEDLHREYFDTLTNQEKYETFRRLYDAAVAGKYPKSLQMHLLQEIL